MDYLCTKFRKNPTFKTAVTHYTNFESSFLDFTKKRYLPVWSLAHYCLQQKCIPKNILFSIHQTLLRKNTLKRGIPHSKANIRLAAISATAKLFF